MISSEVNSLLHVDHQIVEIFCTSKQWADAKSKQCLLLTLRNNKLLGTKWEFLNKTPITIKIFEITKKLHNNQLFPKKQSQT
jgi:hypothetical protein